MTVSFKRFFQLFLFYFLSILVAYGLIAFLAVDNFWLVVCLMTIVGYLTLGIPLTLLSLKKKNKTTDKDTSNFSKKLVSFLIDAIILIRSGHLPMLFPRLPSPACYGQDVP